MYFIQKCHLSVVFLSVNICWSFVFSFRLLNVLEVIAPFKHFNKLREFVQMKLPPGFPVKLGKQSRLQSKYQQKMC